MRQLVKYIAGKTWRPVLEYYLSRTRTYRYRDLRLSIPPGIFHPGFFFTTKMLLHYINELPLKKMKVLELGAGNGLLSMVAAKQGAQVTAVDISHQVIAQLRRNAQQNNVDIHILVSDLFSSLPSERFDLILINPPFYKKDPVHESEYAWYCGAKGEYFEKLFSSLAMHLHHEGECIMVLSQDCAIAEIMALAAANGFSMQRFREKKNLIEKNYLYRIQPIHE